MKLFKYLNENSEDSDKNDVRSGKIQLVNSTSSGDLIDKIKEKNTIKKIDRLLAEANKKLKRDVPYSRVKFAFVTNENSGLDDINVDEETKARIKKRWLVLNSELAKIQMDWEERN